MSRANKQIYYKQIIGNNLTMLDLKDAENFNKMTKVNLELIGDSKETVLYNQKGRRDLDREFCFEFKRSKLITVDITSEELIHYKHLYLNLNGVGYFKVDLEIGCYFENLVIDSIPHVKAYNHHVELEPLKNDLYNLTLCQHTFDRAYVPLTIVQFHLPLQLSLKQSRLPENANLKIDYVATSHQLYIQLINVCIL